MSRGVFITGTGTDVGKTFVSALMVKKLRECGINAGYYKAALSGADLVENKLVPGDAAYVCRTAAIPAEPESLVSYVYQAAVSPHLAAKLEGNPLCMETVVRDFQGLCRRFDYLTVEGSGGIVCPLRRDAKSIMLTDVIKALSLGVVIVSSSALGSINNAVLTAEYLSARGIKANGFILNNYDKDNYLHADNRREISALTGLPIICTVRAGDSALDIDSELLKSCYGEVM